MAEIPIVGWRRPDRNENEGHTNEGRTNEEGDARRDRAIPVPA